MIANQCQLLELIDPDSEKSGIKKEQIDVVDNFTNNENSVECIKDDPIKSIDCHLNDDSSSIALSIREESSSDEGNTN